MKIALVHDYLTQRGGAERVFELLCTRFPNADIFTSLYDPQRTIELGDRRVNTNSTTKSPWSRKILSADGSFVLFQSSEP